jgi:hypothetical protein
MAIVNGGTGDGHKPFPPAAGGRFNFADEQQLTDEIKNLQSEKDRLRAQLKSPTAAEWLCDPESPALWIRMQISGESAQRLLEDLHRLHTRALEMCEKCKANQRGIHDLAMQIGGATRDERGLSQRGRRIEQLRKRLEDLVWMHRKLREARQEESGGPISVDDTERISDLQRQLGDLERTRESRRIELEIIRQRHSQEIECAAPDPQRTPRPPPPRYPRPKPAKMVPQIREELWRPRKVLELVRDALMEKFSRLAPPFVPRRGLDDSVTPRKLRLRRAHSALPGKAVIPVSTDVAERGQVSHSP